MRTSAVVLTVALVAGVSDSASAIPAFARKYRTTCAVCHAPVPRLNDLGELFAENGFEFTPGEEPRDTIQTGDPLLRLQRELPLAVRIDAYLTGLTRKSAKQVSLDQQTPWVVKLLSGGQVANRISYYMYFLLSERGEVAGLEDAYVQFTRLAGADVNLIVGQFQVSDPLLKRELRLHYEDYQPYRVRVGDSRADLTYDRGLMMSWSPRDGTDIVAQLVNGQGLRPAGNERQYDADSYQNAALRLSHDVGPLRVGAFGYRGRERVDGVVSRITIYGPDASLSLGTRGELNVQFLRRTDGDPFYGACTMTSPCPNGATAPFATTVDAFMGELVLSPGGPGSRWFFTALTNWIDAQEQVLSLRLGEQDTAAGFLTRYRTSTVGVHHVLRRNFRLLGEGTWDHDRDQLRLVAGFSTAF